MRAGCEGVTTLREVASAACRQAGSADHCIVIQLVACAAAADKTPA